MYFWEFEDDYFELFEKDALESYDEYAFNFDIEKQYPKLGDNISDTIVFHPEDRTTDFLSKIYEDKGYDVVNDPFIGNAQVTELIKEHQRVICLGHGSPEGLFGGLSMLIDDSHADFLKNKEVVAIWCHADQYMERHKLSGFYSGMFISEVLEASMYGIEASHQQIQQSNRKFAVALGRYIDDEDVLGKVKSEYKNGDPLVKFNRERLYRNNLTL